VVFELIPIVGGLLLGRLTARWTSGRMRWICVALGGSAIALFAGIVSGELAESPGFLVVDLILVYTAWAVATVVTGLARRRRPASDS
jgi:hypothetical protein